MSMAQCIKKILILNQKADELHTVDIFRIPCITNMQVQYSKL